MSIAVITSFVQQLDSTAAVLNGGSVTVYAAGTTTPLTLYSDSGLTTTASNPITLDSSGRHDMRYIATAAYKVLVKNSAGTTIYTRDNIDPGIAIGTGDLAIADGGTGASSAAAALTNLGGYTAAEGAALAADIASLAGTLSATDKTHIATGTTAQRPASPAAGDIRRNTTTSRYEAYNGSAWVNFAMSPPTRQILTSGSAATYTTPSGCVKLLVRMVGGGGGGGAVATNSGATGSTTLFNSIEAIGGGGGVQGGTIDGVTGGAGGTGGAGSATWRIAGSAGGNGFRGNGAGTADQAGGGNGAPGIYGVGAGRGGYASEAGVNGVANSGAGGGGGSDASSTDTRCGAGGGAGEYVEIEITGPSATYTYTVGAGGAGGSAGTFAGGNGGSGIIIVEEYY